MRKQICASITEVELESISSFRKEECLSQCNSCLFSKLSFAVCFCVPERLETLLPQTGQSEEELLLRWKLVPARPHPTWEEENYTFSGPYSPHPLFKTC